MTDLNVLLRAALDDPEDDAPRLVLADWLDEHGQPERAEFIRVQCSLARLAAGEPRRPDLLRREADLLAVHERDWLGDLYDRVVRWRFRRGFVEEVEVEPGRFFAEGAGLFERAPVRHVRFCADGGRLPDDSTLRTLAASPLLARLRGVKIPRLDDGLTAHGVRALAASPHAASLRALALPNFPGLTDLGLDGLGPEGARVLAEAPHLGGVTSLELAGNRIGDEGVRFLAASPHLTRLAELNLSCNDLTDEAVHALAGSPNGAALNSLDLSINNDLGPVATRLLCESPHLGRLTRLALEYTTAHLGLLAGSGLLSRLTSLRVGAGDVRALAASPRAAGLTALRVGDGDPIDADALARSPHLAGLTSLEFGYRVLRGAGLRAILASPFLTRVSELSLAHNDVGLEGVRALAGSPWLGRLTHLDLSGCGLSAGGLEPVVSSPAVAGLTVLRVLSENDVRASVGDSGLQALAASPYMTRLTELAVGDLSCSGDGVAALLSSPLAARLTRLSLVLGGIRDAEVRCLADPGRFPRLNRLAVSGRLPPRGWELLVRRWGNRLVR
jgi:uncharacterized protein (TIGR02996 family)